MLDNELELEKKQCLEDKLVCKYDYLDEIDSKAESDFEHHKIVINVARMDNIKDGKKTVRHEARHFWQVKNFSTHIKWWWAHLGYYDLLYEYSMEKSEIFTIEKDAESYAESGDTSYEKLLLKDASELEKEKKNFVKK